MAYQHIIIIDGLLTLLSLPATKVLIGANIALPAACLCVCMHLERVASVRQVRTTHADKRRRQIIEACFCFGLPALWMALRMLFAITSVLYSEIKYYRLHRPGASFRYHRRIRLQASNLRISTCNFPNLGPTLNLVCSYLCIRKCVSSYRHVYL